MKNQLTPQKRMNKNGVMVTKHVRDAPNESPTGKLIPAPLMTAPGERNAQVEFLGKALHSTYEEYLEMQDGDGMSEEELEARIEGLDGSVLAAYYESIRDNPGHGFEDILISAMHNEITSEEAGTVLFIARIEGELDLDWSAARGGALSYIQARRLHAGLDHYAPELSFPCNLLTASEKDQATATVLIDATFAIFGGDIGTDENLLLDQYSEYGGGALAIDNVGLVDLLVERPDETQTIIDLMEERQTCDSDALRLILDADVQAVREGIL